MWWGTITISKDGKTRTALLHSIDSHGKKQTVTKVYDRCEVQPIEPTADRRVSSLVINSTFSFVAERTPASRGSAVSR